MSNNLTSYTKQDKELDKYLGTNNLRPGPPRRLNNKKDDKIYKVKVDENKKVKINYCSYSLDIKRNIKWDE
jgi:hypothetical protein